jgi:hypothetical protein
MTLEQLTERLLLTVQAEDFEQLDQVLAERDALLASGSVVTPSALETGNQAYLELLALKQGLIAESSRLEQIRKIVDPFPELSPSRRDYFG